MEGLPSNRGVHIHKYCTHSDENTAITKMFLNSVIEHDKMTIIFCIALNVILVSGNVTKLHIFLFLIERLKVYFISIFSF